MCHLVFRKSSEASLRYSNGIRWFAAALGAWIVSWEAGCGAARLDSILGGGMRRFVENKFCLSQKPYRDPREKKFE